jgi:hypothetical protein
MLVDPPQPISERLGNGINAPIAREAIDPAFVPSGISHLSRIEDEGFLSFVAPKHHHPLRALLVVRSFMPPVIFEWEVPLVPSPSNNVRKPVAPRPPGGLDEVQDTRQDMEVPSQAKFLREGLVTVGKPDPQLGTNRIEVRFG